MKTLFALMLAALLVGLAVPAGWAQTQTSPAPSTQAPSTGTPSTPAPSASSPSTPGPSAQSPSQPGGTSDSPSSTAPSTPGAATTTPPAGSQGPATTMPGGNVPPTAAGTPAPGDRAEAGDGRIFGLSRGAAILIGVVALAVIIGLIATAGRRERDVVVESRTEIRPGDEPIGRTTYESEIERERRRRAS